MIAADTFANEWTNAEAYYAAHPKLERLSDLPRATVVRLMAVARTVTELEGEAVRITVRDEATSMQASHAGTVIGRSLLADITQASRWLILVRSAEGQVWAIPEDQVIDIADA